MHICVEGCVVRHARHAIFAEAKQYLRGALDSLTTKYIARQDPDLVAELISCLRHPRFFDAPSYLPGISFLLKSQSPDGSWGRYEKERIRFGDFVRQGYMLHSTLVALDALTVVFHEAWNTNGAPSGGRIDTSRTNSGRAQN